MEIFSSLPRVCPILHIYILRYKPDHPFRERIHPQIMFFSRKTAHKVILFIGNSKKTNNLFKFISDYWDFERLQ